MRTLLLAEWDAFPNELRYSSLRFTVTRLHDYFSVRWTAIRRIDKDFREFFDRLRVLRREREGGMGALLDGDGDRLRLPQVPESQGERMLPSLTRSQIPQSTDPRRSVASGGELPVRPEYGNPVS